MSQAKSKELFDKLVEYCGGVENFFSIMKEDQASTFKIWEQNTDVSGRILRSHLYVEHYITEYLQTNNPNLGSITNARLSFSQKIMLFKPSDSDLAELIPGIKRLNEVRNRLAHRLHTTVTEDDKAIFLQAPFFSEQRKIKELKDSKTKDPTEVLERFSYFCGTWIRSSYSPLKALCDKATRETEFDFKEYLKNKDF